jgi:ABC-2 type transport system ATP-binding protein
MGSTTPQPAADYAAAEEITVSPTVGFFDGIVQGTLNATSARYGSTSCSESRTASCMTYEYVNPGGAVGKLNMGTVPVSPTARDPQSFTVLPYLTWNLDTGAGKGTQTFEVRVTEVTEFAAFITGLPLVGATADQVIDVLQQTRLLGTVLAPLIGASTLATIRADLTTLAPGNTPLAFTYKVTSFDGTLISTNFFPATQIEPGEVAPLVFRGPGLAAPGSTDPYVNTVSGTTSASLVPPIKVLREANYNVISWDPRGEFASTGVLQMDNPFYEGRDVSALISWAAGNPLVELDGPGDPAVGMVGGSYGGGIQFPVAGTDPRVDAVVPSIAWDSLISSLYPREVFKSAWSTALILALINAEARINPQIYTGIATGLLFNWVSETAQAMFASSGPTVLLNKVTAPTLLLQSTVDGLFPLAEAVASAQRIIANPFGTPVKMIWFCGAHGYCLDPSDPAQSDRLVADSMAWLNTYVAGTGSAADDIPTFQWWDQKGNRFSSALMPFEPGFNQPAPYTATGTGGLLPIVPLIGGSGPLRGPDTVPDFLLTFPLAGTFATAADNAIDVAVNPAAGSQIVGAPQLSFTYRGVGTGKAVFAQLVDNSTGRVVGNSASPIPVTLDGKTNTVSVPMEDIAYSVAAGDSLTLQIVAYASSYANASIGLIDISDIQLDLPLRNQIPG